MAFNGIRSLFAHLMAFFVCRAIRLPFTPQISGAKRQVPLFQQGDLGGMSMFDTFVNLFHKEYLAVLW